MTARSVHRLSLHSPEPRELLLEPSGMVIDVAAGDEIVIETTAADPPDFDAESFTHWAGVGAELRVWRRGEEIYSTMGNPVPAIPPGMSMRGFIQLLDIDKLRRN